MADGVGRFARPEVEAFVRALEGRGSSSYTQRSYGLGAAHFLRWLEREHVTIAAVDATLLARYVADFRRGQSDGPALGRARISPAGAGCQVLCPWSPSRASTG